MTTRQNKLGQPIGAALINWQSCQRPSRTAMQGRYCRVEILDLVAHSEDLFNAFAKDADHSNWTYLPYGPFPGLVSFQQWVQKQVIGADPLFHAVIDNKTNKAVGIATYLRIEPDVGVIETGHIHFSPLMQRTPVSTEAMYLMMRRVFDELGYRRYEWKCDALNAPSCTAAERLGFQFEGVFRQATMYKGRNRDTAWFSILDSEWPEIKAGFERWLSADNFDENGQQKSNLVTRARAE